MSSGVGRGSGEAERKHLIRLGIIAVTIFTVMSLVRPELFFTAANFRSMAFQFPEYGILALAVMLAMLTGGIDLSIIGTANLSGILAALLMGWLVPNAPGAGPEVIGAIAAAIALSLMVGALCGVVNGVAIAGVGIPPILATLGTGLIFTGIAIVITEGRAVLNFPDAYAYIGNGRVGPVPAPVVIFAVLAVGLAFVLSRTKFGLRIYLMGTNPLAARFAGIDNAWITMRTYIACGMLSSCAGLVLMSRANSAKADYGTSYLLLAVLIAVLGGTNPYGGFGRVLGIVLAVFSLQCLSSGFNMLQFSNFAKELVWGLTLLTVMGLSEVSIGRRGGGAKPAE